MNKYRVTISLQGKALVDVQAPNQEAARQAAIDLTLYDLAQTGRADLLSFKIIPGELNRVADREVADDDDDEGPRRPRPSGWYRPAE